MLLPGATGRERYARRLNSMIAPQFEDSALAPKVPRCCGPGASERALPEDLRRAVVAGRGMVYAMTKAIEFERTYHRDTSPDAPMPAAFALMARHNTVHQLPHSVHRSAIQNELFYIVYLLGRLGFELSTAIHAVGRKKIALLVM